MTYWSYCCHKYFPNTYEVWRFLGPLGWQQKEICEYRWKHMIAIFLTWFIVLKIKLQHSDALNANIGAAKKGARGLATPQIRSKMGSKRSNIRRKRTRMWPFIWDIGFNPNKAGLLDVAWVRGDLWFLDVHNELGNVPKFGTSRPLFLWRNGWLKKVQADSAPPPRPDRVRPWA